MICNESPNTTGEHWNKVTKGSMANELNHPTWRYPLRIATIIIGSLMGLLFLFASLTFLFKLITSPPLTGAIKVFNDGLDASVYLMPTVKIIELLCGLAFVS